MNVKADWIMVNGKDGDTFQGVKERNNGEKVMSLSELQKMANDVIELGNRDHSAFKFLFINHLEVVQGIYKWNEESKSFLMVIPNLKELRKIQLNVDAKELLRKGIEEFQYQQNEYIRSVTKLPDFFNNK
jgi:hypothetical protein